MKKSITARLLALLTAAMMLLGCAGALADDAAPAVTEQPADEAVVTGEPDVEDEPTAEPGTEQNQDTRPAVDAGVVALIGDSRLTAEESADWFSYVLSMYSYYGYDVYEESINSQLRDITLDMLVDNYVQKQMWISLGFDQFTDEELAQMETGCQATYDATYDSIYAGFEESGVGKSELHEKTMAELEQYDYTLEALMEAAMEEAAYARLFEHLTKAVTVTDADVEASHANAVAVDKMMYGNDPTGFVMQCMYGERPMYVPEGIRTVKHILIKYDDDDAQDISELMAMAEKPDDYEAQYEALKQAAYENIKDTVDEIMGKLAGGESFDALVEEYGEDQGMNSEPYKSEGYMVFEGCTNLVEEFVTTGMALEKVGDVTETPALTSYGAHIMLYFSDLTPGEVELTEERAYVKRTELLSGMKNQAFSEGVEGFRATLGDVYVYPENLVEAVVGTAPAE